MVLVLGVGDADAQTPPPPPPATQPAPPVAQPAPPPPPMAYPPPTPMPMQSPYGDATATEPSASPPASIEVGALAGFAVPINRRPDQVPMLGGLDVSLGYRLPLVALWLDYQSYANIDATHATVLVSASLEQPAIAGKLHFGGRVGFGPTFVNFHDPAFADITASTIRVEAAIAYDVSSSWVLWARPMTFDWIYAADLGGPIFTYQMSAGVAFRFGRHHQRAAGPPPPPPTAAPPPVAAPPPPYPNAPPPPFPVPGAQP